jgi:NodT family efflux transporter outer membrane factor (OMF) lipoprotein
VAALLALSCVPKAAEVSPPVELPEQFAATGPAARPSPWWTAMGSEQLDRLVGRALAGNFSLRVAWDRLDQARALAERAGAPLWPQLDASAGGSRSVQDSPGRDRQYANQYSLGVLAGYELDVWGRLRSAADAAELDTAASAQQVRSAAVTLSASVARTWVQLIEQRGQLALLDEQLATNQQYLQVITLRFRRGQSSAADVLQQRQLVQATRGQRVLVEANLGVLGHQLAVLLGEVPGRLELDLPADLPAPGPVPRTGVPAEVLRRRPDVRAAELAIQAADLRVASAVADQWPKLSLTVRADTSADRVRDLLDNWLASIAANLAAPLIDGGRRRAEVRRTRAVLAERLDAYGQALLDAYQEVADALVQEAHQVRYLANLRRQLDLSRQAAEQTLERYTKGTSDFTRYLTTLLEYQRLQRTYLQARRRRIEFRIDLHRALAGSWPLDRPRSADQTPPPAPAPWESAEPAGTAQPPQPMNRRSRHDP